MKKKVNEIIENQPNLKKDKKVLEKTINFLDKNNPKVFASKKFKKSLRARLDWLIWLKQNKKSHFVIFAIPVFSFMFVVWGVFYYIQDVKFVNNNWAWKTEILLDEKLEDELIIAEIDELWEIFDNQINQIESEDNAPKMMQVQMKQEEDSEVKSKNFNRKIGSYDIKSVDVEKSVEIEEFIESDMQEDLFESFNIEAEDNFQIKTREEDYQNDEDISEPYASEIYASEIYTSEESSDEENNNEESIWAIQDEIDSIMSMFIEEEYSFDKFCEEKQWVIYWSWETVSCEKEDKKCMLTDFVDWDCEFK